MIIAFTGYAGSGKDTAADYLVENYDYKKNAFADPLRDTMEELNPIVGYKEHYHGDHGFWVHQYRYREALEEFGYQKAKEEFPEIRRLMQVIGTDIFREMDEDIWVNLLWKEARKYSNVTISDLRFPNEAKLVHDNGGYVIRLIREDLKSKHPSETNISELEVDWTIINDGNLDDLYDALDYFMEVIAS